jgi:hypothetical protein
MTDEKKDEKFELEDTPEIAIGDGNVGTLWKVVTVVLVIICVYYLFAYFKRPPAKQVDEKQATEQTK